MEPARPTDHPRGGSARRRLAWWVCALLLTARSLHAAPLEIIVVSEENRVHARILESTREVLEARGIEATLREIRPGALAPALVAAEHPGLVITLGARAAQSLKDEQPTPVLHAAIARAFFEELLASDEPATHPHGHSALFLDQPPARQIAAMQLALPQLQRVGLLASSEREGLIEPLANAARTAGIEVVDAIVAEEGLLIPRVEQLLRYADALLITPDPSLYNRYTLQKVLLAAYRQRKPVIGLSAAYVKAGALLAVHSAPEAIGIDLGDSIARFVASGQLNPPAYPRHYAVAVNHHVARSLGLHLPVEATLLESLRQREARP